MDIQTVSTARQTNLYRNQQGPAEQRVCMTMVGFGAHPCAESTDRPRQCSWGTLEGHRLPLRVNLIDSLREASYVVSGKKAYFEQVTDEIGGRQTPGVGVLELCTDDQGGS